MSYARDLTFNLRIRGFSEDEIADTLDEVRAHESAAGTPADDDFGAAQDYAKQFPKKKMRSRGATVIKTGVVLAIIYGAVAMLLLPFLGADIRDFVGPVRLWPALVLVLGGLLAGFLTDYYRPVPRSHAAR
ncbi:MAG: hypothetical protein JWO34_2020 [Arthrobacter sp.]|nr:hypothetical protein [Arthrobacter sp.]